MNIGAPFPGAASARPSPVAAGTAPSMAPAMPSASAPAARRLLPMGLFQHIPISTRGAIVLLLALYLVLGPARLDKDLVSSVVGYGLLALSLAALCTTFVQASDTKLRFRAALSAQGWSNDSEIPTAGYPTRITLKVPQLSFLPLTFLEVTIEFEQTLATARHVITGFAKSDRVLFEDVTFPHRGDWRVKGIRLSVGDRLGLTSAEWLYTESIQGTLITVHPPQTAEHSLPVISSAVRTGDAQMDLVERQGDPFDLKMYHPADGIRRILWKVFAKRGELIARHPERAVSPEGQVVAWIIADERDDHVCAEVIHYAKTLLDLDLQIWFGCEAQGNRPVARRAEEVESLLIESVWQAQRSRGKDLEREAVQFLDSISSALQHSRIEKVIVFVSQERVGSSTSRGLVESALRACARNGRTVVVVPIPSSRLSRATSPSPAQERLQIPAQVRNLFLATHLDSAEYAPAQFQEFLSVCATQGWEVIL